MQPNCTTNRRHFEKSHGRDRSTRSDVTLFVKSPSSELSFRKNRTQFERIENVIEQQITVLHFCCVRLTVRRTDATLKNRMVEIVQLVVI